MDLKIGTNHHVICIHFICTLYIHYVLRYLFSPLKVSIFIVLVVLSCSNLFFLAPHPTGSERPNQNAIYNLSALQSKI
jgi:hypothetical protein